MTTSPHPLIIRPGGYSAKNTRPVGAPNNHQGSGENLMVGSARTADDAAVTEIQNRLYANAERFVQFDHPSGRVIVHFRALAALVAEIVAERIAVLQTERDAIARESELREQEVISLTVERDRLRERAVEELAGSTNGPYADYFRDKLTGGER